MVVLGVDLVVGARLRVGVSGLEHCVVVVVGQDVHHAPAVPVVGDSAPVVYVTRSVGQHLKSNPLRCSRILVGASVVEK